MMLKNMVHRKLQNEKYDERKEFPTLESIATTEVGRHFEKFATLEGLDERLHAGIRKKIIENAIELTIKEGADIHSVNTTARSIHLEEYWKKACEYRWSKEHRAKTLAIENNGLSWKVAYLERHVTELIEKIANFEEFYQKKEVIHTLHIVSSWIFSLDLAVVPQNFDLRIVFENLPLLREVTLKYSEGPMTEKRRDSVGMKLAEAANLGESVKNSYSLVQLNVSGNEIDDDLFKFIMAGVACNISLLELNLSHNRVGDHGAKRLAKFLIRNEILVVLNLTNNCIGYDGSRYLSQALKINKTLEELHLKLNKFDDKAGSKFFKDLSLNTGLLMVDLSANSLGHLSARKIAELIQTGTGLRQILLGSNDFSHDSLVIIKGSIPEPRGCEHFEASKFSEIRL
ncbi:uncharacterized protein LOC127594565 [Hippocampus zosterae]|uniref:uncharacterized protein LOC127594565 n=1 Tax=Hippocampus zosterae TaxID=109293 RepID=UPI00223E7279|nr:uncharacterized protein LOC127594565 [Hippocampus zosterae]